MNDEFDDLVADDYRRALLRVSPIAAHHLKLLGAHFQAPDHTISINRLASDLGYKTHVTANQDYSMFARFLCRALGVFEPELWISSLVRFPKKREPTAHLQLELRPAVIEAIQLLKWFTR